MSENTLGAMLKEVARVEEKLVKGYQNLLEIKDVESGVTPAEVVYQEDKVRLLHYKPEVPEVCPVPLLVVYALVNRQYMMDVEEGLSLFRKLLGKGIELYVIDWGYPTKIDKYLTMEDHILGYLDNCVDLVRERSGCDKINVLGICQGGSFTVIYSALFPEKIKNLAVMVAPIDFHAGRGKGLLMDWIPLLNPDLMVDVMGTVPGEFLNLGFLWLKPFQLIIDKYVGLTERLDNATALKSFLRMEKWIFDSPDQAGETFRKYVKELFRDNQLIKGEFTLGGRKVDLKNITMPVLNMFGEQDHLVPPECSRPLSDLVSSQDVTTICYPVGHIGMYVSSKAQKEMSPTLAQWLLDRSAKPTAPATEAPKIAKADRKPKAAKRQKKRKQKK
jgi:polyhydroxyalkanoate synthase